MDAVNKGELFVWISSLEDNDPRLEEVDALRRSDTSDDTEEPFLSLKEVASKLGYADHTMLHRLKIQRAGVRLVPAGRLKYKMSRVHSYLQSPEAMKCRQDTRRKRSEKSRLTG
jgi:hypothetical protein